MDRPTGVRSVGVHGFTDLDLVALPLAASVRIPFVFRRFSIDRRHPLARGAAEIAAAHGRFWQKHTQLFSRRCSFVRKASSNTADRSVWASAR